MSIVHVLPVNDLIEHDEEGDDCPCGPTVEPVFADDGYCGWLITHHSLDGREKHEWMKEKPSSARRKFSQRKLRIPTHDSRALNPDFKTSLTQWYTSASTSMAPPRPPPASNRRSSTRRM